MSVDNAYASFSGDGGLIQEFIYAFGGLFHGASDYVDLVRGRLLSWLRFHGDARRVLRLLRWFLRNGFFHDGKNVIESDFHAQWPRFHFRAAPVNSTQYDRRRKSSHANI